MKKTILFLSFLAFAGSVMAQKVTTTSAVISFDATTAKDALPKAENKTVIASLDKTTGTIMFEAAVNNFAFSNPMMHDHFNGDKWMNSGSFPKFTFTGKIDKVKKVKFDKNGTHKVNVTGNLTIKGITKSITIPGIIIIKDGTITSSATFSVKVADYGISSQYLESGKVSSEPKIKVSAQF